MNSVEVITNVQRRRRWFPSEKKAVVEEAEEPGMSISAVATSTVCIQTSYLLISQSFIHQVEHGFPLLKPAQIFSKYFNQPIPVMR